MIKFQIPDVFFTGFTAISQLTTENVGKIANLLREVPVGISLPDFQEIFEKSDFPGLNPEIAETIFSFGGILANKDTEENIRELALGLSHAYQEKKGGKVSGKVTDQLNQNLLTIFKNAENLKKTFKAMQLLSANAQIYRESTILTDIRLLFDDVVEKAPECGVVLHQLKIEYVENEELKSFFVCLNNEDVIGLIDNLKRALKKEDSIIKSQDNINFISFK